MDYFTFILCIIAGYVSMCLCFYSYFKLKTFRKSIRLYEAIATGLVTTIYLVDFIVVINGRPELFLVNPFAFAILLAPALEAIADKWRIDALKF